MQRAVTRLGSALRETFGGDSKAGTEILLEQGLIGEAIDDANRQIVVVVDPSLVPDQQDLEQKLQEAVGDMLTVNVQSGCFSAAELVRASRVIYARDWHPDADSASIDYWLDPATSEWHVEFDPKTPQAVITSLKSELGPLVTIHRADSVARRAVAYPAR